VEESCEDERRLHAALMQAPRMAVAPGDLAVIRDPDARHNYEMVLRLRDRLLGAGTVEACYRELFRRADIDVPPLFLGQLVQVILRNLLEGGEDALQARAAELFFREQKATIRDGHVLVADLEAVQRHAEGARYGNLGRLVVEAQGSLGRVDLDVLDRANAALYWERESRHDTVISLTYGRGALDALARVMEKWVLHFMRLKVLVKPLRRIEEARWAWHAGLDAESTAILNDLWRGDAVDPERMRRILALFSLEFADPGEMRRDVAGRATYLALSAGADDVVRMKPQNLLLNLPVHEA